ncbi:MAG TPA: hypothetical protein VID26_12405 [Candidatus Limnocylindrales bacterium]
MDPEKVRDDAWSAARSALPRRLPPRRQRRRRWPLLAVFLGLAGAALGWLLLLEAHFRLSGVITDHRRSRAQSPDAEVGPTVAAEMAPEIPYLREMAGSPA